LKLDLHGDDFGLLIRTHAAGRSPSQIAQPLLDGASGSSRGQCAVESQARQAQNMTMVVTNRRQNSGEMP
jgi:hypothetical protein